MQITPRLLCDVVLVSFLSVLAGCGSSGSGTPPPPPPPPAYSFAYLNHVGTNLYQIKMMKTDGTSQTSVGSTDNFTYVRLSPDRSKIVFSYLDGSNVSQIGLINADGSGRTNLTLPPQQPDPNYPQYPQFTSDGTKIIYQSLNGSLDIVTINLDGSNPTYLTSGGGNYFWPTISPDGQLIALGTDSPAYSLATMNSDGSGLQVIEDGPDARYPAFSSDGKTIFFNNNTSLAGEFIYSISVDGTNLKQLTQSNYDYCPLVLGNTVLFQSTSNYQVPDSYQVFAMAEDGSGVTQLTHDAVFDGFCP
jgi:Tol biopolymer transport system component